MVRSKAMIGMMIWWFVVWFGCIPCAFATTMIGARFEQEEDEGNAYAPSGTITAGSTSVPSGAAVAFTASGSDSDGDTLSYAWQATEGTFTSATTSFKTVYLQAPTVTATTSVTITLTVSDGRGKVGTTTTAVTVTAPTGTGSQADYILRDCTINEQTSGITLIRGQGNVPTGCFVVNQGHGAATKASYTYFYVYLASSGSPSVVNRYGNHYVTALAAGESSYEGPNLDVDTLSVGTYILFVQTDATGKVSESSETNNTATLSFTVVDAADLADGMLIRGTSSDQVYILDSGTKRSIVSDPTDALFTLCGFSAEDILVLWDDAMTTWADGTKYPAPEDHVVVKGTDSREVYLLDGNTRRWIASSAVFAASGLSWSDLTIEYQSLVDGVPDGMIYPSISDGVVVKGYETDEVYILDGGTKRWIASSAVYEASGLTWDLLTEEDQAMVDAIANGETYPSTSDGIVVKGYDTDEVYILDGDAKRWIASSAVYEASGLTWDLLIQEEQSLVDAVPAGETWPALEDEVIIKGLDLPAVFILDGGTKRWIPTSRIYESAGFTWDQILWEDQSLVDAVPFGGTFEGF